MNALQSIVSGVILRDSFLVSHLCQFVRHASRDNNLGRRFSMKKEGKQLTPCR
jgi:hypothetical protein